MITDRPISNIFIPRNNWVLKAFSCKKSEKIYSIVIRDSIKSEYGYDPFFDVYSRTAEKRLARQLFAHFMHRYTSFTPLVIGTFIAKDRTTILHSLIQIKNMNETDKSFKYRYDNLDSLIKRKLNIK